MICCVYTADKNKKNKVWKEGFASTKGNKMTVYSCDRKFLCSFCYGPGKQEYETSRYLVYIEEQDGPPCSDGDTASAHPGIQGRSAEEILAILGEIEEPQHRLESRSCFNGNQPTST
eukprot:jgi/Antlo1/964/1464